MRISERDFSSLSDEKSSVLMMPRVQQRLCLSVLDPGLTQFFLVCIAKKPNVLRMKQPHKENKGKLESHVPSK